jgi:class 3 adenylate cyclase
VLAGVIGRHKFSYDVWGDTVNVASRLQAMAEPGQIWLSETTRNALQRPLPSRPLGPVEIRGRGVIEAHRCLDLE